MSLVTTLIPSASAQVAIYARQRYGPHGLCAFPGLREDVAVLARFEKGEVLELGVVQGEAEAM